MLVILPNYPIVRLHCKGRITLSLHVLTESQVQTRLQTLPQSTPDLLLLLLLRNLPARLPRPPYLLPLAPEPRRPQSTHGLAEAAPPGATPSESCSPVPHVTPESLSF